MADPNPKKLMGDKKPPLHLLPLAGKIHQALAHMDGNLKYGFENWNESPVEKLTYIGAMERHIGLYKYGEDYARDTGVHNLGAVMACCAILLDAELNGKIIDNTRHSKAACDLLHNAEAIVARLKEAQAAREAAKAKPAPTDEAETEAAYQAKKDKQHLGELPTHYTTEECGVWIKWPADGTRFGYFAALYANGDIRDCRSGWRKPRELNPVGM
jgi:hypothetical protein